MTAAEKASALITLNNLVSIEGAQYNVPVKTEETFALEVGDAEYTIGSGGQFDTVRPIDLLGCYLRSSDSSDYGIKVISHKDYRKIFEKTLSGKPTKVTYLPESPLGKIIFNYLPDYAYNAYFSFWKNFTEFAALDETITLPNEYKAFLVSNLAVQLAEDWDRTPSKWLYESADRARSALETMLAAQRRVPVLKYEVSIGNESEGTNILLDEVYVDGGAF